MPIVLDLTDFIWRFYQRLVNMKHTYFLILFFLSFCGSFAQTNPNDAQSELIAGNIIDARPENEIRLYPNPATGNYVTIISNSILAVEVFDVLGKKVATQGINDNQKKLNISQLKPGMYLVKLKSEKSTETKKLIIR